jgi:Sulfotransferase domain
MERTVSAAGDGVLRLAMWSGPRNLSTAFMRSWENRGDTLVIDEPFYAHYLQVTGLDHPGRDEIIAHQESDWRRVADSLLAPVPSNIRVFYQKQMSHHLLPHMGREWLGEKLTRFDLLATGLPQQVEIFEHVILRTGKVPAVLDSADLLERPEPMLRALCEALVVPFTDRMLWWPAGRRDSDGIWARHWYDRVEQSTGFEVPAARMPEAVAAEPLPPAVAEIAAQCRPLYERLRAHRLRA